MDYRIASLSLIVCLSACSVYKSKGRDSFENRAPQNTSTALTVMKNETCWNQPADEPLWNMDNEANIGEHDANDLMVKRLSINEIQVCTQATD